MKRTSFAFLPVLFLLALPAPAAAQRYLDTVNRQLDVFSTQMGEAEFQPDAGALQNHSLTGVLPRDGSFGVILQLTAGRTYRIMGVCDEDCEDLDLSLFAADDLESALAEDVGTDDVPLVEWRAQRTGPHLLHVKLPVCTTSLCYFGVRVVGR